MSHWSDAIGVVVAQGERLAFVSVCGLVEQLRLRATGENARLQNELAETNFAKNIALDGVSRLVRERAELREKVEALGCVCEDLRRGHRFRGTVEPIGARATMARNEEWKVATHDPRCPAAILALLAEAGETRGA